MIECDGGQIVGLGVSSPAPGHVLSLILSVDLVCLVI